MYTQLSQHWKRLISFALIGGGVFLLGMGLLYLFVSVLGWDETVAYVLQAIIAVTANYLLNWRFTWGDRKASLQRSAVRFILTRVLTIGLNSLLFTALVHGLNMHYQVANLLLVIAFTCVNYVIGHKWTFVTLQKNGGNDGNNGTDGRHCRTGQAVSEQYPSMR